MSWTLCTSGAAIAKAGANANTTVISGSAIVPYTGGMSGAALLAKWSDEVESTICLRTRYDWISAVSSATVTQPFRGCLSDTASDMIAMKIINYDCSGYTKLLEAQGMLDVLRDNISKNLELLDKDEYKEKMGV